ncbi:hypothetical protein Tco_0516174 [Tanacetum coccineum]
MLICLGVPTFDVEHVVASIGYTFDQFPFTYLGLPMGKSMRTCSGWNDVVDRFNGRLSAWNAKNLSIGGGLRLLNWSLHWCQKLKSLGKVEVEIFHRKNALQRIVIKSFYGGDGGFGSRAYPAGNIGVCFALDDNQDDTWSWRGMLLGYLRSVPIVAPRRVRFYKGSSNVLFGVSRSGVTRLGLFDAANIIEFLSSPIFISNLTKLYAADITEFLSKICFGVLGTMGLDVAMETTPLEMLEYQARVVMKHKAAKEVMEQVRVSPTKSKTETDHPLSPSRIHKERLMAVPNGDSKDNASTFDSSMLCTT